MSYVSKHNRESDERVLEDFMRQHDFATVVSTSADGLQVSHLPVLVRRTDVALTLVGHMARANPLWRQMDGETPAVFLFHGPHGYISPTCYETSPSVPTWNYAAVHAHGCPRVNEDEGFLRDTLAELTVRFEELRPTAWHPDKLPEEVYSDKLRGIVGFEMPITKLDGKFKLGQSRSVADQRGSIAGLERKGSPEAIALAELMRR